MGSRSDLALASQRAFESGFCEEEPEGSLGARRLLPPPLPFGVGGWQPCSPGPRRRPFILYPSHPSGVWSRFPEEPF